MSNQDYIKSVVRKLVKIDVFKISLIDDSKSISDKIETFCSHMFDFFDYDTNFVSEIYEQERAYHKIITDYENVYQNVENDLNFHLETLKSILEINENIVYYLCQQRSNERYESYALLHEGYELMSYYCDFIGIPRQTFGWLMPSINKECLHNSWRNIVNNPNYPWFSTSFIDGDKDSLIAKKKKSLDILDDDISHSMEFVEVVGDREYSESDKKANEFQFRQRKLISFLGEYAIFNDEEMSFSGLNNWAVKQLFVEKCGVYPLYTKELSENVSNENLNTIMHMFPELGINGDLFESRPFIKLPLRNSFKLVNKEINVEEVRQEPICIGDSTLICESLTVCPHAEWHSEYNEILISAFEKIGLDTDLIIFDINKKPYIKL